MQKAVVVVVEVVTLEGEAVVGDEAVRVNRRSLVNDLQPSSITATSSFSNRSTRTSEKNFETRKSDLKT